MGRNSVYLFGLIGILGFCVPGGSARMLTDVKTQANSLPVAYKITDGCLPNKDQCTHKVGRLWFTITNYGFFGNQVNPQGLRDCLTGGLSSSAEFPGGSQIEYLFQGALWVGAVVGGDTLTSIGTDGWVFNSERGELHADCDQSGLIIRRSKNPTSPYYDSLNAISDLDLIAVMYDTLTDAAFVENPDPQDGRPFKPMGLKIIQSSYSWAAGWGQDWVMLDYKIVNIGNKPLTNIYIGIFVDADVGFSGPGSGNYFEDDLSGFKVWVPHEVVPTCPDTINLAYVYDNDGDPNNGFRNTSPTGVTGIRVVRAPVPLNQVKTSFNWWTPNGTVSLDWGPQKFPGRKNFKGGLGQPEGDAMKYFYLSNGEFDYDQVYSAINQSSVDHGYGTGWLPPLSGPSGPDINIANGFDTRYIVSFGSFFLRPLADDPGDTLRLTLGYVAGEGFHQKPDNFAVNLAGAPEYLRTPQRLEDYLNNLNFVPIATNARWVQRVFDNETIIDTVQCGPSPLDSVERRFGDGVPDFKGPLPPPAPPTQFITKQGEILIRWFGRNTENALDEFSRIKDFEGYRIWMSPDGRNYTNIGSFDKVNWKVYYLNRAKTPPGTFQPGVWEPTDNRPLSWDEIQRFYAVRWDTCANKLDSVTGNWIRLNKPIDPNRFNSQTLNTGSSGLPWTVNPTTLQVWCNPDTSKSAVRVRFCNTCGPGNTPVDTIFYFVPQDYNLGLNAAKLYPLVTDTANDSAYWYQFKISGLYPSEPVYVAVTPFDFGQLTATNRLDPLEVTPTSAANLVFALPDDPTRQAESLKISVFPNPYRIDHDYSHYENRNNEPNRNPDLHRKLNFINLPARCIIRIYTLDGDLVQEIHHDKPPTASDAGYEVWDLLTRNAQSVVAGLYLYTVQSEQGIWTEDGLKNTHVGKIVIIK